MRIDNWVIIGLLSAATSALAAPSNISVTGTLDNGSSVTISGSGFGAKTQGAPELWDNFENGTAGASVAGRSPTVGSVAWGALGHPIIGATNQRGSSTRSYYADFQIGYSNNAIYYLRQETNTGAKKYFSFWWRAGRAGSTWSRNMKPWQHYGSSADQPMYYIGDGTGDGDPGFRSNVIDNMSGLTRSGSIYGCGNMAEIENEWIRWEGYVVLSDPNVQNGQMEVWRSEPGIITRSNCIHHATAVTRATSNGFRQWAFGEYLDATGGTSTVYMDDIYIDDTLARVELCDASTWSAVTHCEVQPPTAWSTSSITATVNAGSFTTGQTAYLYVIDSDGDANSSGYAVTIGESGGGGTTTITCYQDADNDGYGRGVSETVETCSSGYYIASHFTSLTGDEDDNDASVYPGSSPVTGGLMIRAGSMRIGSGSMPITLP